MALPVEDMMKILLYQETGLGLSFSFTCSIYLHHSLGCCQPSSTEVAKLFSGGVIWTCYPVMVKKDQVTFRSSALQNNTAYFGTLKKFTTVSHTGRTGMAQLTRDVRQFFKLLSWNKSRTAGFVLPLTGSTSLCTWPCITIFCVCQPDKTLPSARRNLQNWQTSS